MFHADFFGKRTMQLAALIAAWPMKILSREYVFAAWTAAAVLILSGCSESQTTSAANNERQAPITVSVILEPAYQPQLIQAAGSVAASARIEAASRLAAYIEEIPVKEGDLLQKGDVLFKLDSKDVLAAIHAADGKLKAAQAALKDAELDREKIDALYREGLVSNNDWRKATLKRDGARADLAQAQGFASAAHGELEYIIGKSPREGRVVRVLRRAGDMAVPGLPIVVLDSEEAPKFEFRVPQSAAQYAKPGVLRLQRIRWREPILFEPALRRLHPAKQLPFGQACSAVLRSLPVRRQDVLYLNRRLRGWADWRVHLFCKLVAMRTQAKINAPIFIGCVSALVKTVLQKYLQVWKTLVIHPFALLIDRNISSLTAIV